MSSLLLHDSARSGKLTWAIDAVDQGYATGLILSPFDTPPATLPRRAGASECGRAISDLGGAVYLDPATHGAALPGTDRFQIYDLWALWPGTRGNFADRREHVQRAIAAANRFGLQPIAPTIGLEMAIGSEAESALEMAEWAVSASVDVYLSVVGTANFWASGAELDAFVGALVALRPRGWVVTAWRHALRSPWPGLDPAEVTGICRTVHTLSLRGAPVIAGHGDLAGLPSIAAGADLLGSGWDLRHRVCAHDSFRNASGMARTSLRVTHRGLLAWLKRDEAERLYNADNALSGRLVPNALPVDFNGHWRHHLRSLDTLANRVIAGGNRQARVRRLRRLYEQAANDFDQVAGLAGQLEAGRQQWIAPLLQGLNGYGTGEGW